MNVIFGIVHTAGMPINQKLMKDLGDKTLRWSSADTTSRIVGSVGMGTQQDHTHARSSIGSQPLSDECGNLVVLDGRIDNYKELGDELDFSHPETSDAEIVLAAYRRWDTGCFGRLIGDWAVALWSGRNRSILFARDHIGSRSLYVKQNRFAILWSSVLDSLVSSDDLSRLDERYLSRYLAQCSLRCLTPFKSIFPVPAAHYLIHDNHGWATQAHWTSCSSGILHFKNDEEYPEALFTSFRQAVRRRIGPGGRIIAHLSGGLDSSSIVCMADDIYRTASVGISRCETLSYYDISEPDWDDDRYFCVVESQRGQQGIHIPTSFRERTFEPVSGTDTQYYWPGADSSSLLREQRLLDGTRAAHGTVLLAGYGGDELLGGRPDPLPELAELAVTVHVRRLFRQTFDWCLALKQPFFGQLGDLSRYLISLYGIGSVHGSPYPGWVVREDLLLPEADCCVGQRHHKFWGSPRNLHNRMIWESIVDSLPHTTPAYRVRFEYRYPILDRDLMELIFRIPRAQIQRPNQRRYLMKRAFNTILPSEVIQRRRKALVTHGPIRALQEKSERVYRLVENSILTEMRLVNQKLTRDTAAVAMSGKDASTLGPTMRFIALELWLRHIRELHPNGVPV